MNWLKHLSGRVAESFLFRMGKQLWELNQQDWNLPLSRMQKLMCGLYIVLKDYSQGEFPPVFQDRKKAYQAEIDYMFSLKGVSVREVQEGSLRKPFWYSSSVKAYLGGFADIVSDMQRLGVPPKAKILEFGSGIGWMAEFLALSGFEVKGTSISSHEIEQARVRIESIRARGIEPKLSFDAYPMEEVGQQKALIGQFDVVLVFEALHHAFNWREAVESAYATLKPGGWFLICAEPNLVHTFSSYRVAKLSNTHEIGFSRSELLQCLHKSGFSETRLLRNRYAFLVKPHWIAARKPLNAPATALAAAPIFESDRASKGQVQAHAE